MMKKSALDGNKPNMPGLKLPNWLGAVGWGAALFSFGAWGPKLFPGLTNTQERNIAEPWNSCRKNCRTKETEE